MGATRITPPQPLLLLTGSSMVPSPPSWRADRQVMPGARRSKSSRRSNSQVVRGLFSGRGKDLMKERNLPVDGAYYLPTLREWFVESTLFPFIGGDTVRRSREPVPGLLPGINHILPYANSLFGTEYPKQAFFELSRCCLESSRDVMLALEQTYREQFSRNLTLSRLSEAVILPLCPDKGACLHYDPNLAASVYLENDLEQLLRGAV